MFKTGMYIHVLVGVRADKFNRDGEWANVFYFSFTEKKKRQEINLDKVDLLNDKYGFDVPL